MKATVITLHNKGFFFSLSVFVIFAVVLLASCQKPGKEEPELQSAVNVVNATINMPQFGFFINGGKIQGDLLKYTDESGYFVVFPGARTFDVQADGINDYILRTNFTFKPNTYHTIFVTGESNSISSFFTDDDLSNPPSGKAKLRFVNLSPDAGGLILALKNGTSLFTEQPFKSTSPFINIDPGVYDLQVKTPTGTILVDRNVTVSAGVIYTAWAKGMRAGTSNSPLGLQFRSIN